MRGGHTADYQFTVSAVGLDENRAALTSIPTRELVGLFLKLGFTAFGGPAAHIALMKEEVVTRLHWMTEAEFLDLLGATNLIPGPNSTQMAIHIGYRRHGWSGLIAAGVSFHPGSVSDRAPDTK